ncbi:exported hypothetical protein [Pseudomonas sp. IT-P12]
MMLSALRCSFSAWSILAACPTTSTCSVSGVVWAALKRSLAIAMAKAVSVKLTSPAVRLRWYMVVLPKSPITPGKWPGNWEGTLGSGDDSPVTSIGGTRFKPGFCRDCDAN